MLQPGESLYLSNINLSVPILPWIPSRPLWRAVGSNRAVDFAEWVVDQVILWTGLRDRTTPTSPSAARQMSSPPKPRSSPWTIIRSIAYESS